MPNPENPNEPGREDNGDKSLDEVSKDHYGGNVPAFDPTGAKVLSRSGFNDGKYKDIVESSFDKSRKNGEKLHSSKNGERRSEAYLSRLEKIIEKYGNAGEKKLWEASAKKLIIEPENIQDSYWKSQEQILRDNGQVRELSDWEKDELTKDIQNQQEESLKSWANYLGDENSPYPLWFKVFAWDGMSKMGVFDKQKGHYVKRDETTVAPYPNCNPAALAKTFGQIADFYGIKDSERFSESEETDKIMEDLVKSGNFNKLYSKIYLIIKLSLRLQRKWKTYTENGLNIYLEKKRN